MMLSTDVPSKSLSIHVSSEFLYVQMSMYIDCIILLELAVSELMAQELPMSVYAIIS